MTLRSSNRWYACAAGGLAAAFIITPLWAADGTRKKKAEKEQPDATVQVEIEAGKEVKKPDAPAAAVEMRKVTFLGVVTEPVPDLLRNQLQLPEGIGLVVDHVAADSPAQKAGLAKFDVIHKLDDQLLANADQLRALVQSRKNGDTVKLTVIRQAQAKVVEVTLSEQAVESLGAKMMRWRDLGMEHARQAMEKMQRMAEQQAGKIDKEDIDKMIREFQEKAREFQEKAREKLDIELRLPPPDFRPNNGAGDGNGAAASAQASATYADGEHVLTLKIENGRKHLTAKDRNGKILFEGPANSDEERARVPAEIRNKLQSLESKTKIDIHIGPNPPGAPPKIKLDKSDAPRTAA